MNMSELVTGVAAATGLSAGEAKAAVTAVFDQVSAAAAKGEEVAIFGFGKFTVKDRPEREGRNPATGQAIKIPASRKISFTASKSLKDRL